MSSWPEGTSRAEALSMIPIEWLWCRATSHPWKTDIGYGVDSTDAQGRRVTHASWRWRRDACTRCGMTVERIYDPFFALTDTHYDEPTETGMSYYLPPHPESDVEKHDWRREAREELWRRLAGPPPEEQAA